MDREVAVKNDDYGRLSVSRYDKDFWVHMMHRHGTAHVTFTREQIEQLVAGLQRLLAE
jgi:hypothetical protein